jgi:hypothetical protein
MALPIGIALAETRRWGKPQPPPVVYTTYTGLQQQACMLVPPAQQRCDMMLLSQACPYNPLFLLCVYLLQTYKINNMLASCKAGFPVNLHGIHAQHSASVKVTPTILHLVLFY